MASIRDTVTSAMRALELIRDLGDESPLTASQRAALRAWPGWGVLAPAFGPEPAGMWLDVADRLDSLLEEPARAAAADIVDTAFYTPPTVAAHLWQVLAAAGFAGGRVLDRGCGHGALMDAAPSGLAVEFTGIEVDPTSARIAGLLHPSAAIYTGRLQATSLRDNHFDAVVANVPFSSVHVYDSAHEIHAPLHTYFLRRAVRAVRPGGYVVVIADTVCASPAGPEPSNSMHSSAPPRSRVWPRVPRFGSGWNTPATSAASCASMFSGVPTAPSTCTPAVFR
ncbi:methyltransferase domain-containing protein [Rhodococcus hoagii]|nr:methyltransferase domain-containing protein [Prescottella equi]